MSKHLHLSDLRKDLIPRVKLRIAREAVGWSQHDLAEKIGTGQVSVSRWETGETVPSPFFRKKLCQAFQKEPSELDLVGGEVSSRLTIIDPLVPPPVSTLIGREAVFNEIQTRLCQHIALTTVNGLPGVGKTTLAVALAHDQSIRCAFPDGILWVGLGTNPDVIGQLRRWASLFGIQNIHAESNIADALALNVRSAIGERRMLIAIDDVWKIEDALQFQIGGPNCVHLITTRFSSIAVRLASTNPLFLHELDLEQGLTLLNVLAPQISLLETAKTRSLVSAVGGLPLALTLMGSYLRSQSANGGQRRRIATALDYLNKAEARLYLAEPQGPADRHPNLQPEQPHSLHSIIAFSEQPLSQVARTAFYALSVLPHKPQTFSEAAARAVCACSPTIIDDLVDAGLVECAGDGWYTLHQTIADYAHAHLSDPHPGQRLLSYTLAFIKEHATEYDLLDQESSTILVSLEIAYQQGSFADLIQGVCTFTPYLLARANYVLAEQHLQRAHEASLSLGSQKDSIKILLLQGQLSQQQGNYDQSQNYLNAGLALACEIDDNEHNCALLYHLGRSLWKQGHYTQAGASLSEGLVLARRFDFTQFIGEFLHSLGILNDLQGYYDQAEIYLYEGLAFARQTDEKMLLCKLVQGAAIIASKQGNRTQAETLFQEGLEIAREIKNSEMICVILANIGHLKRTLKNYVDAETLLYEGLQIAQEKGLREWEGALLFNLVEVLIEQDQFDQAEWYIKECLVLAKTLHIVRLNGMLLYVQGTLALHKKRYDDAETFFDMLGAMAPEGDQELLASAQYGRSRLTSIRDQISLALQLGESSTTLFEEHHKSKK